MNISSSTSFQQDHKWLGFSEWQKKMVAEPQKRAFKAQRHTKEQMVTLDTISSSQIHKQKWNITQRNICWNWQMLGKYPFTPALQNMAIKLSADSQRAMPVRSACRGLRNSPRPEPNQNIKLTCRRGNPVWQNTHFPPSFSSSSPTLTPTATIACLL